METASSDRLDLVRAIVGEWLESGPSELSAVIATLGVHLAPDVLVSNGKVEIAGQERVLAYLAGHGLLGSSQGRAVSLPAEWKIESLGGDVRCDLLTESPFEPHTARVEARFSSEGLVERLDISFPRR